jgi:hypothetical protein
MTIYSVAKCVYIKGKKDDDMELELLLLGVS